MQSMVQTILRTYAGVFDNPTPINIELIATKQLEESIFRLFEQTRKVASYSIKAKVQMLKSHFSHHVRMTRQ